MKINVKQIGLVAIYLIVSMFFYDVGVQSGPPVSSYDYGEPDAPIRKHIPLREVSIIVTESGYYPKHISINKGDRLKLFITSTNRHRSCFTLPSKGLFLAANKGSVTETEVRFKEGGIYHFYCPSNHNLKGRITVLEKKKRIKRSIATVKKTRIWMPKDF